MSLYKDRGEKLAAYLERLIAATEEYLALEDTQRSGLPVNSYQARRDLRDEIDRAKDSLKDDFYAGE